MRFLVTGAAGFIGSHLTERLLTEGHEVTGVDDLTTGLATNYPLPGLHVQDIADRHAFYAIANHAEPDVIVHCAASYSNPDYWHRDTDTNVAGTINCALAARHHNARLLYFQTALPPVSSYAISKIAGEQYLTLSGVPLTVFRLANMYGPRNLSGPIPTFYKRLTAGQACTVADTERDMVYVQDLVDAVMAALERGAEGKFDICSGRHRPIIDLYDTVAGELAAHGSPSRVPAGADDVKQMVLDPTPARDVLGWEASTPLAAGVRAAVGWYREHGVEQTYTHLNLKG